MEQNHRILIRTLVESEHQRRGGSMELSAFFELFSAEQILKSYELSYQELTDGIVDGNHDGGIDSIYLFVDGYLDDGGEDYTDRTHRVELRIVIIQSKNTGGFTEDWVHRLSASLGNLFSLDDPLNTFSNQYNPDVLRIMQRFRDVYDEVIGTLPNLAINIYAVGSGVEPSPEIRFLAEQLRGSVQRGFPGSTVEFDFLGAVKLLEKTREIASVTLTLTATDGPLSTDDEGLIFLVSLRDLYDLIKDDHGNMRKNLFESNVRDYQGRTEVNEDIRTTLQFGQRNEDFWWLNNGITILCTESRQVGHRVVMEQPQIVNGMQTSTEIYNYFVRNQQADDDRKVLVRVLKPLSSDSRDRIIKATNFQTKISDASLRATDAMQRDIEDHMRNQGLYYDRRKNFYKNEGRQRHLIVEVRYLAQAYMSIVLQRPDDARARPLSLLKNNVLYRRIFDANNHVDSYVVAAKLMRKVDAYLEGPGSTIVGGERNNVRFHVAMHLASHSVQYPKVSAAGLAAFDVQVITDLQLRNSLDVVLADFLATQQARAYTPDRAAKSTEFADLVFAHGCNVPAGMQRR